MGNIDSIGEEVVKCSKGCFGVCGLKEKDQGIMPRCINLEERGQNGKRVIIVGMNPGRIKKESEEAKYYAEHNCSYSSHKRFMKDHILYRKTYHKEIRDIAKMIGFDGDILWTEIVKCQSEQGITLLPVGTIRTCVHTFLKRELKRFNAPIIAVGKESFRTCSLLFPENNIIGIQHPSGSNRTYNTFKENLSNNIQKVKDKLYELDKPKIRKIGYTLDIDELISQ